ncbi:MAG TPA: hypothetical protein PKA16_05090 [Ottowia sp.]|uniref:hypothetical protein n=1 Tax=Ottowia sp. TaxID=1898956 RepID=UPI002B51CC9C|nr:hypothetical protein [Ottowia sp.]HMN20749.1 hypothetical protein [Ottowia sp.]
MTSPPPPPLPPELLEALKERNLGKLFRVLLQPPAAPASDRARPTRSTPGGARPPAGPAAGRGAADPGAPRSRGRDLSPGEVPRSGATAWTWLVLLLLAYLGYRLWQG